MSEKISVILPVYNGATHVGQAIRSVLAQTRFADEIVVVDDGSTDDTPSVLGAFGGKIRVIRVPNGGASTARNIGMAEARGDYFAFLDHDDVWFKEKLELQMEAFRRFPEVGILSCDYISRFAGSDGRHHRHSEMLKMRHALNMDAPLEAPFFLMQLKGNLIGTPSTAVVRRNVAERARAFDPEFVIAQDYDFWLRCARSSNLLILSKAMVFKRAVSTSLSTNLTGMLADHEKVLLNALSREREFLRAHRWEGQLFEALSDTLYDLGDAQFEEGRRIKAFASYIKALFYSKSTRNSARFAATVTRKSARWLSGGWLSRRRVRRWGRRAFSK